MKAYKMKIAHNGKFVMARYFTKRSEAISKRKAYNYAFNCDGYKATLCTKSVELKYHHSALERGYISKNSGREDYYCGKYGVGIKRHIPNCESKCSNEYHLIEYYIEIKN